MSLYYRINDGQLVPLSADDVSLLAQNKRDLLRPYVVDPKPTPSPTQYVAAGPVVVSPTEARKTWALVDKPAQQIANELFHSQRTADLEQIRLVYSALKNGTGTAAERLARCERVLARLLKDIFGGEPT